MHSLQIIPSHWGQNPTNTLRLLQPTHSGSCCWLCLSVMVFMTLNSWSNELKVNEERSFDMSSPSILTTALHVGHLSLFISLWQASFQLLMHLKQKVCRHGSVLGSVKVSLQIAQVNCASKSSVKVLSPAMLVRQTRQITRQTISLLNSPKISNDTDCHGNIDSWGQTYITTT